MTQQITVSAVAIAAKCKGIPTGGGFLIRCPCPGHGKGRGDRHPSLFIRDGDRRLRDGSHRLLVRCYAGCDSADVLEALNVRAPEPVDAARARDSAAARTTIEMARFIWSRSMPLHGSVATRYLRARGLNSPFPAALRFLNPSSRYPYPTLVAAIVDASNRVVAVELTYLDTLGSSKAGLAEPRRVIGAPLGGAIHCASAAEILGLAEGLETALSAQRLFGVPVWAATSAERLPAVVIPERVRKILYFGDADKAGALALEKLRLAHPRIEIEDRTAPVANQDWNDLLRAGYAPTPAERVGRPRSEELCRA